MTLINDWSSEDEAREFNIPTKPLNPMTPERLAALKKDADERLLKLYYSMIEPSGSAEQLSGSKNPAK